MKRPTNILVLSNDEVDVIHHALLAYNGLLFHNPKGGGADSQKITEELIEYTESFPDGKIENPL